MRVPYTRSTSDCSKMEAVLEVLNFDICDKNFSMRELFSCLDVIAKVYQSLDPATIQKATKFDNLSFI